MLSLEQSDYDALGYARQDYTDEVTKKLARILYLRANFKPNPESLRATWRRYASSPKGKAAAARRDAKRPKDYFKQHYQKNKEAVKARVKAWRESLTGEALAQYKAKQKARDAARYAAKKAKST